MASMGASDCLQFRVHFIAASGQQVSLNSMAKPRVFLLERSQVDELVKKHSLVGFNQDQKVIKA